MYYIYLSFPSHVPSYSHSNPCSHSKLNPFPRCQCHAMPRFCYIKVDMYIYSIQAPRLFFVSTQEKKGGGQKKLLDCHGHASDVVRFLIISLVISDNIYSKGNSPQSTHGKNLIFLPKSSEHCITEHLLRRSRRNPKSYIV
jgi:hypothetical protein